MPFVALRKDTRERVDITEIDNPRLILHSGDCVCQLCEKPLILKAGFIVRPHFAHYSESDCDTEYKSHPETPEHREAKIKLVEFLKSTYIEYTSAKLEKEVPIREIKRVADILVVFPMGWRVAHEIQLAGITIENLQERTNDYSRAGIDVVWWLGKSANTPANRAWCIETFGCCFTLNIENIHMDEILQS